MANIATMQWIFQWVDVEYASFQGIYAQRWVSAQTCVKSRQFPWPGFSVCWDLEVYPKKKGYFALPLSLSLFVLLTFPDSRLSSASSSSRSRQLAIDCKVQRRRCVGKNRQRSSQHARKNSHEECRRGSDQKRRFPEHVIGLILFNLCEIFLVRFVSRLLLAFFVVSPTRAVILFLPLPPALSLFHCLSNPRFQSKRGFIFALPTYYVANLNNFQYSNPAQGLLSGRKCARARFFVHTSPELRF